MSKAESFGLTGLVELFDNLDEAKLARMALDRQEARVLPNGPLVAQTGTHTGRSPKDKFIVRDSLTETAVGWDTNAAMTREAFNTLLADMQVHARGQSLFVQDLFGGADPAHRLNVRVFTQKAWHALFIRHLLIRPGAAELESFAPQMTILNLPSFKAEPARHGCRSHTIIACDFTRKIVLIAGTLYAGEMKKSVFSLLNFLLPDEGVMPMHCAANKGTAGDTALFFGLSGTGKTTLSADASRTLIGDDEHGWSPQGIFNFEGGCYAKAIRLNPVQEPEIYAAVMREGAVLENVVLKADGTPDFDDASLTENTRGAYPLHYIQNAAPPGVSPHPKNIIFLTADAFGVLPPVARLNPAQTIYYFLSGYTAKVAGTERGVSEPQATFSTCFGAPFMPRHPTVYGALLQQLIATHGVDCWLVNTGWTGGAYGTGSRMPIKVTRRLLNAVLDGTLKQAPMRVDPVFGFKVPQAVAGIEGSVLNPRATWPNETAYDVQAARLADMFRDNFTRFASSVDASVFSAGPGPAQAVA